ncbi:hypothetical protein C5S31_02080 [ANME-1 cluster archaeon GoMg2]|nr:hypothetical protein [ANME-1 cluster archaeon GoMg2]
MAKCLFTNEVKNMDYKKAYPYLKALLDASIEAAPNWAKAPGKFVSSLSEQLKNQGEEGNKQLEQEISSISEDDLRAIIKDAGCDQKENIELIVVAVKLIPEILQTIGYRFDNVDEKLEVIIGIILKEKPLQPFEVAGQSLLYEYPDKTFLVKDFDGNWFKFPRSYPTVKLRDTKEELKDITSWKIVHTSVEKFYRVYNDFHIEIIRWEQAKYLDHQYYEMQRSNAQRRLKSIRPQFEDFSEQLKSLPSSIIENEMISILSMLPTCHEALMQSIGAADSHQIDYVFEFSERIADWLLHTLRIADSILELYFRQKENEGENR